MSRAWIVFKKSLLAAVTHFVLWHCKEWRKQGDHHLDGKGVEWGEGAPGFCGEGDGGWLEYQKMKKTGNTASLAGKNIRGHTLKEHLRRYSMCFSDSGVVFSF